MLDYSYEIGAHNDGFTVVCGVDEAGRGPLAGPVFAGAVILPENYTHEILNDSKKLSEKKRDLVYDDIIRDAICWSVGIATEKEIDEINILNATFLAIWAVFWYTGTTFANEVSRIEIKAVDDYLCRGASGLCRAEYLAPRHRRSRRPGTNLAGRQAL